MVNIDDTLTIRYFGANKFRANLQGKKNSYFYTVFSELSAGLLRQEQGVSQGGELFVMHPNSYKFAPTINLATK